MIACPVDDLVLAPTLAGTDARDSSPVSDRLAALGRPLRTLFLLTSMPVGGAEILLVNMLRRFRPDRIEPEVACTKEPGPLGEVLAKEFPVTHHWLKGKFDFTVIPRLAHYFRQRRFDALVTVGAGDKMFWGRIAARVANLPVVCSALHSTGWPDGIGRLNRCLTPWTDRYIAVAASHGQFLVDWERFPREKVVVIPNGVDTSRFCPDPTARRSVRQELGLAETTPLVGIVAALRPEKNHAMFVAMAQQVLRSFPEARFTIIGDGPERRSIEALIDRLGLRNRVLLLGTRSDTPRLVAAFDVFALTSHNEASPVSILEALACGVPVVSTRVGSITESVVDNSNGFTVEAGDAKSLALRVVHLLSSPRLIQSFGESGRQHVVDRFSLDAMVSGYQETIASVFFSKR